MVKPINNFDSTTRAKKYNHMFDVAFTLETNHADPYAVPMEDILDALARRLEFLRKNPEECAEAFGFSDSYEVES